MAACKKCGKKIGLLAAISSDYVVSLCQNCGEEDQRERDRIDREARIAQAKKDDQLKQAAKNVIVTTTPSIDGYFVKRYLGIESVEFVIGTGAISEFTSAVSDAFGARSTAFEGKLQQAKQVAMSTLKLRAATQGANAVVGVDLDFTEFSGNRVALILNGTLVEIAIRPVKGGLVTEGR